jgi:hydroxymethylbilane synthase
MAQTRLVVAALEAAGDAAEIVTIETDGDRHAPDTAWGEGAFVTAIEAALLDGRLDVAVHSAKDLPTRHDERLLIAAFLPRADPRDALVGRHPDTRLTRLPVGARVGTDSPRRTGFLLAARPDLQVHPLNGNVDTRLRRLDAGQTDALCLAVAGLERLGATDRIGEYLDPASVPPAPGQGAIAVQVRSSDERTRRAVARLDDHATRATVEAERAFLRASGGGCRAPIGALATLRDGVLNLHGGYVRADGGAVARATVRGRPDEGDRLARDLVAMLGARLPDVARELRPSGRVLVARPQHQAVDLVAALAAAGLAPVVVPAIAIELCASGGELDRAVLGLERYAWVVVTSANGAAAIDQAHQRVGRDPAAVGRTRFAAVGRATAKALHTAGFRVDHEPPEANADSLAGSMPLQPGDRVLLPRADIADDRLPQALRARGADIDGVVAYRTVEAPPTSRPLLAAALAGERIDALVLTSGSTARGLLTLAAPDGADRIRRIPAICIGPRTAAEARALGFAVAAESPRQAAAALAELIADVVRVGP